MDYSFLAGLSGRKNWDKIDAQEDKNLQYQYMLNNIKEQNLAKTQERVKQLQDYYAAANDIHLLEPDRLKVKAVSDELKDHIKERIIKEYGGDFDKYAQVEGPADARSYLNSLLNHPTTVRAMHTAANLAMIKADEKAGLMARAGGIDPNSGQLTDTPQQAVIDYYAGAREDIPYNGAFKPGKVDDKIFGETYANKDKTPQDVSAKDYFATHYRENLSQGLNPRDATQQAIQETHAYKSHLDSGGTALQYKSEDPEVRQARQVAMYANIARTKLAIEKQKQMGEWQNAWSEIHSGNKGVPEKQNVSAPAQFEMFGQPAPAGLAPDAQAEATVINTPLQHPIAKDAEMNYLGLTKHVDKDTKEPVWKGQMKSGDQLLSPGNLMHYKGNINDFDYQVIGVDGVKTFTSPTDGKKRAYSQITVKFKNNGDLDSFGALNGIPLFRHATAAGQGEVDKDNHTLKVLVPADHNELGERFYNEKVKSYFKQNALDNDDLIPSE